jgi:acyl carrier protein
MDDLGERLTDCFLAVFPELERGDVSGATSQTVPAWDSVAGVTLLAVVEEEFGIAIDGDDLAVMNSFAGFLSYLRELPDFATTGLTL